MLSFLHLAFQEAAIATAESSLQMLPLTHTEVVTRQGESMSSICNFKMISST